VLAIAKARARSLGLDGMMEFRESDGEQLELPESTAISDTIPSRGGLMFLPTLSAALLRTRQTLLASNGRLSAAVMSVSSKVPLLDLAFSPIRKQINAPAPPLDCRVPSP
jgi:ubiquinone/menaquinone biosynthesis C-methylase UbiE